SGGDAAVFYPIVHAFHAACFVAWNAIMSHGIRARVAFNLCKPNTVSNLDVTLRTLQSRAPKAKIIVVMQPSEAPHIGKLTEVFAAHSVLKYPVSEKEMRAVLQKPA
ncbi:MAG: hypothetical protein AB1591_08490, partial [Pseudomonadota bacterium]